MYLQLLDSNKYETTMQFQNETASVSTRETRGFCSLFHTLVNLLVSAHTTQSVYMHTHTHTHTHIHTLSLLPSPQKLETVKAEILTF
jgi:hypothetical protein